MPAISPFARPQGGLTLQQAIQHAIAAYQRGDWPAAERSCRGVLNTQAYHFEALHLLGLIASQTRRTREAAELLSRAVWVNPKSADAFNDRGNALQDLGQLDEAAASYRRALEIKPALAEAHVNLGNALDKLGRLDDAVTSYQRALEIKPAFALAYNNLSTVLRKLGQLDGAVASCRRALEIQPNFALAHYNLGNLQRDLGQFDDAATSYRRALEIKPDFAEAHNYLGIAWQRLGRLDDAVASCRRALEINPAYAEAHCNLGNVLSDLGRRDDAATSYRRALEIKPDLAEAHSNLGNVLQKLGQHADAVASCRRALEIKPDFAVAHNNLGNALWALGQSDDAVASYHRALAIKPDLAEAYANLGHALCNALGDLDQLDEAVANYRRAVEINRDYAEAHSNLLFCLSHNELISAPSLFVEHSRFGEQFEAVRRADWPVHRNARDPGRRLRIGLVSADLRNHAVAYFIEPLLTHLATSSALSMHAYHSHADEDNVSARLRSHVQHWQNVAALTDAALAQRIEEDGIDILIDLSGHTGQNRLLTFARKPAPVQASWLGYPGTTGLSAMDYYLADPHFLPPGQFDSQFTEKLVYLPASAPFLPDDRAPPVNALPALSRGYVTFGSFNRPIKLRPTVIAMWARLLRALPDARMVLGGMPREGQYDQLIDWFAREGIVRERLSIYPRCETGTYLGLHHQVDLCLDTYPYTGGTTTNHALWMGVPTLTLAGPTPSGRQGAAILGHLGLGAFVAESVGDFVQKGLAWAGNLGALAEVRAELRMRFEQSPIRHPEVIASGLEHALRCMWQRWCAGLPPGSIDVSREAEPPHWFQSAVAEFRIVPLPTPSTGAP